MPFDRIIYFGDSLTDSDEFFNLSSQLTVLPLPSAIFGYDGQFSNGDVYADIAPEILGIGADESVNYAVGGARAVGVNPLGQILAGSPLGVPSPDPELVAFDSNLTAQVSRFIADLPGLGDLSGSAASFFIGLNDFNGLASTVDPDPNNFDPVAFGAAAQQLAADILTSTLANAGTAAAAGVGTIILNTLPVGTFFPLTQGLPAFAQPLADQLVTDYNAALVTQSAALAATGATVTIVDMAAMAAEVAADGQTFGFLNTTDSFFIGTGADPEFVDPDGAGPLPPVPVFQENPALAGLDDDQFAFFDLLHPTTALHGVLGAFQAASLDSASVEILGDENSRQRLTDDDDLALAQSGDDVLFMRGGDDVGLGGLGNDNVIAGAGDDIAAGGAGNDRVNGQAGSDVLAGNLGDDTLVGGADSDALIDGLGSDIGWGGAGDDFFFYTDAALIGGTSGQDSDVYVGGSGFDTLFLVVSDAERANAEAVINQGITFNQFRFDDLGLRTHGIEQVVLLDDRADFDDVVVSAELQAVLDEAEHWGLV